MNAPKRNARGSSAARTAANALPAPIKQKEISGGTGKAATDEFGESLGKSKWGTSSSSRKKMG